MARRGPGRWFTRRPRLWAQPCGKICGQREHRETKLLDFVPNFSSVTKHDADRTSEELPVLVSLAGPALLRVPPHGPARPHRAAGRPRRCRDRSRRSISSPHRGRNASALLKVSFPKNGCRISDWKRFGLLDYQPILNTDRVRTPTLCRLRPQAS